MRDQADRMIDDMLYEERRAVNTDNIPLKEWEEGEVLDNESPPYDHSSRVRCCRDGATLEAVGYYSCGELQKVDDVEVKGMD
jgi:hypothetical protein